MLMYSFIDEVILLYLYPFKRILSADVVQISSILQYNHEHKSKTKFISSDCLLIFSSISIFFYIDTKKFFIKKIANVKILRFPQTYKIHHLSDSTFQMKAPS